MIFLICADPAPAVEQPRDLEKLSLEELMELKVQTVYGASKFAQQELEAPASISIITADEIRNYGYRTFGDALRSVRGLYVTNDRNYSYLGVRGFLRPGDYNTRILIVIDGHRLNDNVYDSAYIGTEFYLDLEQIDRIEIIRGPGSSLYGTNAFFAVINVFTKQGRKLNGAEISGQAGSLGTYRGRVGYGREFQNGLDLALSGSFYSSSGHERLFYKEFNDPATNNGRAEEVDDDTYRHFFSRIALQDLTLEGLFMEREKSIPTASFGTVFNDPQSRTFDRRYSLGLTYDQAFTGASALLARLHYDSYYYEGQGRYDWADPGEPPLLVLNKDQAWGGWWGAELQYTTTIFETNKVIVGAEYRYNARQDQVNFDTDPLYYYLDDKRNSTVAALFLQDEVRITDEVILNAGLRWDRYESFGSTVNPRAALIYAFAPRNALKLIYGEAFRAPNVYELYYSDAVFFKANPDLQPEKIKTWELIFEHFFGGHVRSSLSGFFNRIDNLISQQVDPADGLTQFRNLDEVESRGVELELEGKWRNGLQSRASYTLQTTEDRKSGKVLTNSPHNLAKFNMTAPVFRKRVFAGFEVQYTSSRKTLAGDEAAGFLVANLTLFLKQLLPGLEVSAGVQNLFDKGYGDPGAADHRQDVIEQDGRTFRLETTYHF